MSEIKTRAVADFERLTAFRGENTCSLGPTKRFVCDNTTTTDDKCMTNAKKSKFESVLLMLVQQRRAAGKVKVL